MARLKLDWNAALFPSTRHMVLMDLEATTSGDTQAPGDPVITDDNCEIIEIGLIVIDLEGDQVEPTAKFSLVVRPVLNPTLTQFCTRFTAREPKRHLAPELGTSREPLYQYLRTWIQAYGAGLAGGIPM